MTQSAAGYLTDLLGAVHITQDGGSPVTPRATINFVGATLTDDVVNDRTDITVAPAGDFGAQDVTTTGSITGSVVVSNGVATDTGATSRDNVSTAGVTMLRCVNAAPGSITGFANGTQGKRISVVAVGGNLTIPHESASSTAANRCTNYAGGTLTVYDGTALEFIYDGVSSRWRQVL